MANPFGDFGRRQVQVSMNQRDLDTLTELVDLIKKAPYDHRSWRPTTRSSVIIELVRAELKRRKPDAAKPNKGKGTNA